MNSKDLLEHYAAVRAETTQLEHEIADLCGRGWQMATDGVLASPPHEPYQNRPIPISGYVQSPEVARERKKLVKQYDKQLRELYFWQGKAEEIFARMSDVKARVILRYRYIDGMSWNEIADKLDDGSTEDSVRKYAKRFFEKSL